MPRKIFEQFIGGNVSLVDTLGPERQTVMPKLEMAEATALSAPLEDESPALLVKTIQRTVMAIRL